MAWSRNARLFAYEYNRGAHLPIQAVVDTLIVRLGYSGWVSRDMFSRELYKEDPTIPEQYVQRGQQSWKSLLSTLKIIE